MPDTEVVTRHYAHGSLTEAIRDGLAALGKEAGDITIDDLAPVDEFHVGGRSASVHFLDQMDIAKHHRVLDVGCGLGGGARFTATRYGCSVTGVDLMPEYVATGNALSEWVNLAKRVTLREGDATALGLEDASFDRIYMMHVGMNVADKHALFGALARLLRPGGLLGVYDIMRVGDGELGFPVPWATAAAGSSVESVRVYLEAFKAAGLALTGEQDRRRFALEFFEQVRARSEAGKGPPPLGLHIVMGQQFPEKIRNLVANIAKGVLAPVELIARKPA